MGSYNNNFNGDFDGDFVNRDKYHISWRKPPPKDHPNARDCPQCWEATWKATKKCVSCGYDIFAHDHEINQKKQQEAERRIKEQDDIFKLSFIAGLVVFAFAIYWINKFFEHEIWFINMLPFACGAVVFFLLIKWGEN